MNSVILVCVTFPKNTTRNKALAAATKAQEHLQQCLLEHPIPLEKLHILSGSNGFELTMAEILNRSVPEVKRDEDFSLTQLRREEHDDLGAEAQRVHQVIANENSRGLIPILILDNQKLTSVFRHLTDKRFGEHKHIAPGEIAMIDVVTKAYSCYHTT